MSTVLGPNDKMAALRVNASGELLVGAGGSGLPVVVSAPVSVTGGVAITGTPTVNLSAGAAVNANITNTSVPVSGAVSITGTPTVNGSVSITGTPTVNLSAGAAVNANITNTSVPVAGTVSIIGTPTVNAIITNSAVPVSITADQVVQPLAISTSRWTATSPVAGLTGTASTLVRAAAGATLRNYVADIVITNKTATVSVVSILDGAVLLGTFSIGANATISAKLSSPMRGSLNTAINIQLSVAATAIQWYIGGYTAA